MATEPGPDCAKWIVLVLRQNHKKPQDGLTELQGAVWFASELQVRAGSTFRVRSIGSIGSGMVFGWFRSKGDRDRRKLIKKDRERLESRARRFLQNYLKSDEARKARFYAVIEGAVQNCQAEAGVGQPSTELEDAQIASAISQAAMNILLKMDSKEVGSGDAFVKDAYATVAIAYHRAAGVYIEDKLMQELGTAAVHLLTMATSYMSQRPETEPVDRPTIGKQI